MGVKNLWEVLEQGGGKVVQLDSLRNQRIAIDTSIWLIKVSVDLPRPRPDVCSQLTRLFPTVR